MRALAVVEHPCIPHGEVLLRQGVLGDRHKSLERVKRLLGGQKAIWVSKRC